jgi:hypothetical protein
MSTELFHGSCERNASDAASEEIAAGDVARSVATESDGNAVGTLELITHAWIEDGGFLPIYGQGEFAIFDGEAVSGFEFAARIDAGILGEIFGRRLYRLEFLEELGRGIGGRERESRGSAGAGIKLHLQSLGRCEMARAQRFDSRAQIGKYDVHS